ncbi:MAG TPA: MFS transporter [Polyangia bacterium]
MLLPFGLGYYVSYVFRTANAVIATDLSRALDIGPSDLGLLTSTYFLSFALAQLPVGQALDRHGPKRVTATLLVVAAVGAAVFAGGDNFTQLAIGRGLIGLGVSACLMGGIKALGAAFSAERQASVTGFIMAAGALGALTASTPLAALVQTTGFRGAMLVVGGIGLVAATAIALVPSRGLARSPATPAVAAAKPTASGAEAGGAGEIRVIAGGLADGLARSSLTTLVHIFRARAFWRYAPQAALFTGGFMALQGLWAGAWLREVEGHTRGGAAAVLFLFNLALFAGQLTIAFVGGRFAAAGISRRSLLIAGLLLALLGEGAIVLRGVFVCAAGCRPEAGVWSSASLLWILFGFGSAVSAQVYGVTAGDFPAALSGRVTTAINQLAFLGAFVVQWGLGAAIEGLAGSDPSERARGFGRSFLVLWLLQVGAVAWSARRGRATPVTAAP